MSIEDLEKHNVLLPKDEWGIHKLKTTTSELPLLLAFVAGVAGCLLTFLGGGGRWTWIGICLFFIAFVLIIVMCDRAITRQNERVEREREQKGKN